MDSKNVKKLLNEHSKSRNKDAETPMKAESKNGPVQWPKNLIRVTSRLSHLRRNLYSRYPYQQKSFTPIYVMALNLIKNYKIVTPVPKQRHNTLRERSFLLIDISPGPFLTSTFELIIIKQVYGGGGRKWMEVSCKAALPTAFLKIRKSPFFTTN